MATFTWYGYMGTTPDWVDIDTNTICFSGDATDISVPVTVSMDSIVPFVASFEKVTFMSTLMLLLVLLK